MKRPSVHTNWDPLEEIWLGDVWPSHFYDDIKDGRVREAWHQITEWTKEDLNIIQKKLEELGITVKRPYVDGQKELYVHPNFEGGKWSSDHNKKLWGRLLKPPITPRDNNAVIGNRLFFADHPLLNCYKSLLLEYQMDDIYFPDKTVPSVSGANLVKLGRDLIFDRYIDHIEDHDKRFQLLFRDFESFENRQLKLLGPEYRLHVATAGGHCDGCFMPLREGLLLSSLYYKDYEIMFPDWRTINISEPTYASDTKQWRNANKWRVPDLPNHVYPFLNEHIEEFCSDWIGDYTETVFEVNIVMLDESNMLCMGIHDSLFRELERCGITPHVVPFRCRTFWDGGLHCITLDVRRRGEIKDLYPDRGDNGIKRVVSKDFDYDSKKFFDAYYEFIDKHGRDRFWN